MFKKILSVINFNVNFPLSKPLYYASLQSSMGIYNTSQFISSFEKPYIESQWPVKGYIEK